MRRVTAKVSEFLVVRRRRGLENLGAGATALLWPGMSCVTVSAARHEACFELTQETSDGIPLRMKGLVVYRVVDPVAVAQRFDFSEGAGHEQVQSLLSHICLGELRAVATLMTMQECIEQRKTTLTGAVAKAVEAATHAEGEDWGLSIEVVQVAQVFIVDAELRRKLEAETRNQLTARSQLAELAMKNEVQLAELSNRRRLEQEAELDLTQKMERQRAQLEREHRLARERVEADTETRRLTLERQQALAELEHARAGQEKALRVLQVELSLLEERAKQALRLEALPLEQVPALAAALASSLNGASLHLYGGDLPPLAGLGVLVDLVRSKLAPVAPPRT
ncbi:MAG: hypothetical protein JNJ54_04075 [Myxococcaceae bacterium]|nr:hypothetical protein [Myxococcaceae bacterium]